MIASELRVGNYHYYKIVDKFHEPSEWKEVCTIDAEDIVYLSKNPDDPDYEPIPLTEEWLLRFSFEIIYISQFRTKLSHKKNHFIGFDFSYVTDKSMEGFTFYGKYIKINYVHQLQNLYFALTGEELTIKTIK